MFDLIKYYNFIKIYTLIKVLSEKGVEVMREIVLRNESSAVGPENARGSKKALRGLYYLSPFVRDFQNCPQLRNYFKEIVGEALIPHCLLSNDPQVNFSVPSKDAPMDPWHWDSVAYTGVIVLNDMTNFVGGALEIMNMEKKLALKVNTIRRSVDTEVELGKYHKS